MTETPATSPVRSMVRWSVCILAALIVTTGTSYGQGKPKKEPVSAGTFRVYHVLSTKGVKPNVPKQLKRFAKNLARVGTSHKIVGKPRTVTLKAGQALALKLPKNLRPGLGTGSLLLATDGSVTITLKPLKPKSPKDLLRLKSRAFPVYVIDEKRFQVADELYLLILEKVKPTPKK